MAIINGTKGGYLQPIRYGRNESGAYAILEWHGTRAEVLSNVSFVEGLGGVWETQQSFSGAHEVLTARIPTQQNGTDDTINTWEFFAQTAEKDILESDNSAVTAVSAANLDKVRAWINNPDKDPTDVVASGDFVADGSASAAFALYSLMAGGVKTIRVNVPTLRHTATASGANIVKAVLTNVGSIIQTSNLYALEGIPGSVLFALPNTSSSKTGFTYGWYKKHPTIRGAARQKIQIEREWEYGLWPNLIYTII